MKWYENMKLWSAIIAILLVAGTFAAVFLDVVDQLMTVSPFLGGILGGGVFGYAVGKGPAGKVAPVLLAFVVAASSACSWSVTDWTAKAQSAMIKEVSPRVESAIQKRCEERSQQCLDQGLDLERCAPLKKCIRWAAQYAAATRSIHNALLMLTDIWLSVNGGTDSEATAQRDQGAPKSGGHDASPSEQGVSPIGSVWMAYRLQGIRP